MRRGALQLSTEPTSKLFTDWVDLFAKMAAGAAPIIIVLAVVHSWAYWLILDSRIFWVLTLSDHIASIAGVIPILLVSAFGGYVGLGLKGFPALKPWEKAGVLRALKWATYIGCGLGVLLLAAMISLDGSYEIKIDLAVFGCLSLILAGTAGYIRHNHRGSLIGVALLGWVCVLASGFIGAATAASDLEAAYPLVTIRADPAINRAYIIASLSQGLYVHNFDTDSLVLVPWGSIKAVQRPLQ